MKKGNKIDREQYSWVTNSRPKTINEMALSPDYRDAFLTYQDMGFLPNHSIFCGSSGVGKSTLARIIGSFPEYSLIIHNCGENGSKGDFQNIVRNIASTVLDDGKKRLIFLEEYNNISTASQQVLNLAMEDLSHLNTFIIATNTYGKLTKQIIDRCSVYNMNFALYDDKNSKIEMFTKEHGMTKEIWIKELRRVTRLAARKHKVTVPVEIFEKVEKNERYLETIRGYVRAVSTECMIHYHKPART